MKSFFRNVLANIVAFILILVIGFLFFMAFVGITIASSDNKPVIKNQSILVIDSKMQVMDSPSDAIINIFSPDDKNQILIYDVVKGIKSAKNDDRIKGISIEVDNFNAGITHTDNIREAIEDFKTSGKFVYAYSNIVSQKGYYLGSVADSYFLNPVGGIELKGMSTEVVFLKNFAEKLGVDIQVIRHGKYKAAVEPFISNQISEENKDQLSTLLNDIWGNVSKNIENSRKIADNAFQNSVDNLHGIIPGESLENKLVDRLIQKSQYENLLKAKLNLVDDEDLNKISLTSYIQDDKEFRNEKIDHIAILYASGSIYNGKGFQGIYDESIIKEIKELAENEHVKGVVLRVNSPGGSGNASDQILFELQKLQNKKPLVVSFGNYAASGGYYIAMAGEKIYSEPNTITGSIGVFGIIPNIKKLANKNGVRADVVATNKNANYYSMLQGLTPGAEEKISKSVELTYKRFVHFVSKNRNMSFEQVDAIGGGRVWSGSRAKEIGLVDELGSLNDAINYISKKVKIDQKDVLPYPAKKSKWELILKDLNEEEMSDKILQRKLGSKYYGWFNYLTQSGQNSSVMMATPYSITLD